mmetsp:Transcript_20094/g.27709  ORF Transcript_20094/g.27709 Transcript_20094/m.27709 type:complete len:174 (+) Transcript_20094:112-633(+)|eukprot:CAMPEP_0201481912 /NCGR_PEP_ID=MMETSP0151_2-20130828/6172_1 /ASSEMBLY_ACC=CAM_ASM_000257 /TAXON_ID=200890 /ORGANISM="Paramoeba atlantica, Strain 621/1 / CCAP 1560/9" /LENGTH=173 /DNA_ID=CAMNT_0047864323 /DNA_START=497 /DNA_END=1018 /DNA_ORIENTATION=+
MAGLCWGDIRGSNITLSEDGTKATLSEPLLVLTCQEVLANESVRGGESFSWTIDVERDSSSSDDMIFRCGATQARRLQLEDEPPNSYRNSLDTNIHVRVKSGMHLELTLIRPEDEPEKCILKVQMDDQEPFQKEESLRRLEKGMEMFPYCLLSYGWSATIGSAHNQIKPAKRE